MRGHVGCTPEHVHDFGLRPAPAALPTSLIVGGALDSGFSMPANRYAPFPTPKPPCSTHTHTTSGTASGPPSCRRITADTTRPRTGGARANTSCHFPQHTPIRTYPAPTWRSILQVVIQLCELQEPQTNKHSASCYGITGARPAVSGRNQHTFASSMAAAVRRSHRRGQTDRACWFGACVTNPCHCGHRMQHDGMTGDDQVTH